MFFAPTILPKRCWFLPSFSSLKYWGVGAIWFAADSGTRIFGTSLRTVVHVGIEGPFVWFWHEFCFLDTVLMQVLWIYGTQTLEDLLTWRCHIWVFLGSLSLLPSYSVPFFLFALIFSCFFFVFLTPAGLAVSLIRQLNTMSSAKWRFFVPAKDTFLVHEIFYSWNNRRKSREATSANCVIFKTSLTILQFMT